jgi:hypothetical protein
MRGGADNPPGLKQATDAADFERNGRGASSSAVKGSGNATWSGDECECRHE